jgi:hypothetical protein
LNEIDAIINDADHDEHDHDEGMLDDDDSENARNEL